MRFSKNKGVNNDSESWNKSIRCNSRPRLVRVWLLTNKLKGFSGHSCAVNILKESCEKELQIANAI